MNEHEHVYGYTDGLLLVLQLQAWIVEDEGSERLLFQPRY